MLKKFFIFLLILSFILFVTPRHAGATRVACSSALLNLKVDDFSDLDPRKEILKKFLEFYRSPLSVYASYFVQISDKYEIDWKLIPAITGVESSFGKYLPSNSYNAYGWNNGKYVFKNWEESIEKVTFSLKEKYINQGLDSPYKIGPIYAPPSPTWAKKVVYFMDKIENFSLNHNFSSFSLTI